MVRLSHSAKELYDTCPTAYRLKYIEGYREKTISSALWFGSAYGETVQMIILDKKEKLTEEEQKIKGKDPYDYFDKLISTVEINGELIDLPNAHQARYFKSDYDPDILKDEDWEIIAKYREENEFNEFVDYDFLQQRMKENPDDDEKSFYNLHNWLSLRRKGHYMIKAYIEDVYPKIHKVHEIEGEINMDNGDGDTIIGYLDLDCDFEYEGEIKRRLLDHKTSSSKYKKTAIMDKKQLLLYNYDREIDELGYIIGLKKIKTPKIGKRKGETFSETQLLMGKTDYEQEEKIMLEYDEVLTSIKEGHFPKTEDDKNCKFMFGKPCPYINICYNDDDSNLFKKGK